MDILRFVETNRGPVALRRHEHAENKYYTQVWSRTENGDWKAMHLEQKDRSESLGSGLLEALYQGTKAKGLPYEDFW